MPTVIERPLTLSERVRKFFGWNPRRRRAWHVEMAGWRSGKEMDLWVTVVANCKDDAVIRAMKYASSQGMGRIMVNVVEPVVK